MKPNRIVDESTQGKFSWESPPFHGWDGRRFFEYGLHYCFCKIVFVVFIAASLGLDKTDGFKPYSIQSAMKRNAFFAGNRQMINKRWQCDK
jgi:hypothetical protein